LGCDHTNKPILAWRRHTHTEEQGFFETSVSCTLSLQWTLFVIWRGRKWFFYSVFATIFSYNS
jgi:hypothetical protein